MINKITKIFMGVRDEIDVYYNLSFSVRFLPSGSFRLVLVAYYQMKYQGITDADAIAIMNKHGKYMIFHPQLKPQVRDMRDLINGLPCRQKNKFCVIC